MFKVSVRIQPLTHSHDRVLPQKYCLPVVRCHHKSASFCTFSSSTATRMSSRPELKVGKPSLDSSVASATPRLLRLLTEPPLETTGRRRTWIHPFLQVPSHRGRRRDPHLRSRRLVHRSRRECELHRKNGSFWCSFYPCTQPWLTPDDRSTRQPRSCASSDGMTTPACNPSP